MTTELSKISNLNSNEALQLEAKILGFSKMPVTIRQFIQDPYYLGHDWGPGKLYDYWLPILEKIFPDPIHINYTFIIFTGPLGGGKSTVMGIMTLYEYYKLSLLDNFDYFGVNLTKTIDFTFFHLSANDAYNVLIAPIYAWMNNSPYFQEHPFDERFQFNAEGLRVDHSTGHDVISYLFSEISFNDYERTRVRIDQAQDRLKSRFIKVLDYFGIIGLDSSAKDEGSLTEDLIREYSTYMKILVVRDPIWVIKESTGAYYHTPNEYGELTFKVYCGDGLHDPFVLEHNQELDSTYDPDKILDVPNEFYPNFMSNVTLALQNDAGIGTGIADTFITDKKALERSYCIPMHMREVILVDFYDEEQLFDYVRAQILKECPEEKILSIAIDMGITGDLCGFAASYLEDYVRDALGHPTTELLTRTPVAFGISRKPGQETRVSKIYNLIDEINKIREVGLVTTDGYQSTQIRQDIDANLHIWTYLASVDRTKDAYIFYKTQVYKQYQRTCKNMRLLNSQLALQDVGPKIDHPDTNEKDISDAVVSSVYNMSLNPEYFLQISKVYATKMQERLVDRINDTPQERIEDFLKNRTF